MVNLRMNVHGVGRGALLARAESIARAEFPSLPAPRTPEPRKVGLSAQSTAIESFELERLNKQIMAMMAMTIDPIRICEN